MKQFRLVNIYWLVLIILLVAIDQWVKTIVLNHLQLYQPVTILPVLNFTLSFNTGVAFGFLNHSATWQALLLSAFAAIVSIVIIIWLLRLPAHNRWQGVALTFVCSGALGNLIDRLVYGHVIDFISVHWQQHYFAIFNVADSMVCVGVAMLILKMV